MQGKIAIMIKGYTKQALHNAIAHHPLTNTQPVPKRWPLPNANSPQFLFTVMSYVVVHLLGPLRPAVLSVSPPGSRHLHLLTDRQYDS